MDLPAGVAALKAVTNSMSKTSKKKLSKMQFFIKSFVCANRLASVLLHGWNRK